MASFSDTLGTLRSAGRRAVATVVPGAAAGFAFDPRFRKAANPTNDMSVRDRIGALAPYAAYAAYPAFGLSQSSRLRPVAGESFKKSSAKMLGRSGLTAGIPVATSMLAYSLTPEATQNVQQYGVLGGGFRNLIGGLVAGATLEPITNREGFAKRFESEAPTLFSNVSDTLARENARTAALGARLGERGTLGPSIYGFNTDQNAVVSQIQRNNRGPLGQEAPTEMTGQVMIRKPNPLRPGQFEDVLVDGSFLQKNGMPVGSELVGYQVYRTNPLTGKLESTVVDPRTLSAMQGAGALTIYGKTPAAPQVQVGGAYDAAAGSARTGFRNLVDELNLARSQAMEDANAAEAETRFRSAGEIMQGMSQAADVGLGGTGAATFAARQYGNEMQSQQLAEQERALRQVLDQLNLRERNARRSLGSTLNEIDEAKNTEVRRLLGLGG